MSLTIRQFTFEDPDFAICFDIRCAVFVTEQNVPLDEERDDYDATSVHLLARWNGAPAGTVRVILKDSGREVKITRVAVLASMRGLGVGAALMRHVEALHPGARFTLDGQVQALPFYQQLGFMPVGEIFMEAGIPHRRMQKPAL